jgi:hypothetical protein
MQDRDQFDTFVRSGLAQYGVEVDEVELQVIRAAEQTYGPPRDALLAADLSDIPPEVGLDPSRPPRRARHTGTASATHERSRAEDE